MLSAQRASYQESCHSRKDATVCGVLGIESQALKGNAEETRRCALRVCIQITCRKILLHRTSEHERVHHSRSHYKQNQTKLRHWWRNKLNLGGVGGRLARQFCKWICTQHLSNVLTVSEHLGRIYFQWPPKCEDHTLGVARDIFWGKLYRLNWPQFFKMSETEWLILNLKIFVNINGQKPRLCNWKMKPLFTHTHKVNKGGGAMKVSLGWGGASVWSLENIVLSHVEKPQKKIATRIRCYTITVGCWERHT
jgi:hypothetical protein